MNQSKDIMTKEIFVAKAGDSVTVAYEIMKQKSVRHLPVVDDRNKVIGIISDRDIQRAMSVKKINNLQQQVSLDAKHTVEDFMSWPVYLISETTPVRIIAEEMLRQKVSAFIVQNPAGQMKGIVTTDDLLKLFLQNDVKEAKLTDKTIGYYFNNLELY